MKSLTLSAGKQKVLIAFLLLLALFAFTQEATPAEGQNFLTDILNDVGVHKNVSMATSIAVLALIGTAAIMYIYKGT